MVKIGVLGARPCQQDHLEAGQGQKSEFRIMFPSVLDREALLCWNIAMKDTATTDGFVGRTILVTGGAGAIGSNLTRNLAEAGAKMVLVLDDLS